MTQSAAHPCLSCRLPDCDDRSARCELRRAARLYDRARRGEEVMTDEVRHAAVIAFRELWDLEREARQSEAGK